MGQGEQEQITVSEATLLAADLHEWWMQAARREVDEVVPKAVEYSAYDLELIGRVMADTIGWPGERDVATMTELGTGFYLIGKVGRMVGAYREGRLPSDDTLHDISVYCRMIQRTRDRGSWPGELLP